MKVFRKLGRPKSVNLLGVVLTVTVLMCGVVFNGHAKADSCNPNGSTPYCNCAADAIYTNPSTNYVFNPGDFCLSSLNGEYYVTYQPDGNLVVYHPVNISPGVWKNVPTWDSRTHGDTPGYFEVQNDGNFVIYLEGTHEGTVSVFQTGTYGFYSDHMIMQNDGNLVVYNTRGTAEWASSWYPDIN